MSLKKGPLHALKYDNENISLNLIKLETADLCLKKTIIY